MAAVIIKIMNYLKDWPWQLRRQLGGKPAQSFNINRFGTENELKDLEKLPSRPPYSEINVDSFRKFNDKEKRQFKVPSRQSN